MSIELPFDIPRSLFTRWLWNEFTTHVDKKAPKCKCLSFTNSHKLGGCEFVFLCPYSWPHFVLCLVPITTYLGCLAFLVWRRPHTKNEPFENKSPSLNLSQRFSHFGWRDHLLPEWNEDLFHLSMFIRCPRGEISKGRNTFVFGLWLPFHSIGIPKPMDLTKSLWVQMVLLPCKWTSTRNTFWKRVGQRGESS